ncbi:MAG: adenosine deaminase [Acidobacteriota bacterium]
MSPALEKLVATLPKAELHLHLEGSIHSNRLLRLCRKYHTEYEDLQEPQLVERLLGFKDFYGFLRLYKIICQHLREAEDYQNLLDDLGADLGEQNVRYAEVIYTPSIPRRLGYDDAGILAALLEKSAEVESKYSLSIRWILDCVRQFGEEAARRTAQLAVRFQPRGVVAIGLGGDEKSLPMVEYKRVFAWARAHSLHTHVHAGEIGEPSQIWEALTVLGADRIGHGIQAARDPALMDYLRRHAIALDVCLTSNARTGAWRPVSENPFWLLYKRGVPVTLNTDDPGLFQTSLNGEYLQAARSFGLSPGDLGRIALQGVRSSFLPHSEKMALMQVFQDRIYQSLIASPGPSVLETR